MRFLRTKALVVVAVTLGGLASAGCGEKAAGPAGGAAAGGGAPTPTIEPGAVEAVAQKLPEALKGAITFEVVEGEKGRHVAIQPKGWEAGAIPGRVKPPMGGTDLGFLTAFSTGSNCDGSCEAKDWDKVAEAVELAQFLGGGWQVDKDERLPDGRLVVARKEGRVDIALARWKAGESRYFYCRATLDKPLVEAAAAFEEACRQMKIKGY